MSADNFYAVTYRPDMRPNTPWCVGHGFMSEYIEDESWTPEHDARHPKWFASFSEACDYASDQWSEYGLMCLFDWDDWD